MKTNTLQIASYNELNILQREMEHALDTRELIAILFKAIVKNIGISGLHYDNKEMHIHIHTGKTAPHQCNYRLLQGENDYGSITTFQHEKLDEVAMSRIEGFLGMMLMPLQDSLLYQKAMINSCWDPVTRVNNKTAFKRALRTMQQEYKEANSLHAIFIKLEKLEEIYRANSVEQTDNMLHHIIDLAHDNCRSSDQIFRFSDDEFVILLPRTTERQVKQIAHRIYQLCEEHHEHINGCDIDCHVSVDIISCTHECNCNLCPHADSYKCLKQEQNQPASGAA